MAAGFCLRLCSKEEDASEDERPHRVHNNHVDGSHNSPKHTVPRAGSTVNGNKKLEAIDSHAVATFSPATKVENEDDNTLSPDGATGNSPPTAISDYDSSSPKKTKRTQERDRLWDVAFSKLDPDSKKWLQCDESSTPERAIEQIEQQIAQKYEAYQQGGFEIRKRDGQSFNFRDAACKMLSAVITVKPIFTSVASLDPTGHAAAAWTVVSLGLTMVQNDIDRRDAVFEASEFLADKMTYYSIIDDYCWNHNVDAHRDIRESLIKIYTAILKYAAEVKKSSNENPARRVINSIVALTDKPLSQLRTAAMEQGQAVDRWVYLSGQIAQAKAGEEILRGIDETLRNLRAIQAKQSSGEEEKILSWLSSFSFSDRQNSNQELRAESTGDWFFEMLDRSGEHSSFELWRDNPGTVYWLHGNAGCGKSILCSTIVKNLEQYCRQSSTKLDFLAYWYFQFSNDETQKIPSFLRSIIRQLSSAPLPRPITELYESVNRTGAQPDQQTLCNVLDEMLQSMDGHVFLVIDALDECPDLPGQRGRKFLLEFILRLQNAYEDKIHILVTSRPELDIRSKLDDCLTFDLEDRLKDDVETFVRAEVDKGPIKAHGPSVQDSVVKSLLDSEERRFRWAELQIRRLEKCYDVDEVNHALATIPQTLSDLYRDILSRIEKKDRKRARDTLICISVLGSVELETVAAVGRVPSPDIIIEICTTSIITVDTATRKFRLAHFSVKEFLVLDAEDSQENEWYQFTVSSGLCHLALTSIQCVLDKIEAIPIEQRVEDPRLLYVGRHFIEYVTALGDISKYPSVIEKLDCLFSQEHAPSFYNWLSIYHFGAVAWSNFAEGDFHWNIEDTYPPLYWASHLGLTASAKKLMEDGAHPLTAKGFAYSEGGMTIFGAAENGQLECLQILLQGCIYVPVTVAPGIISTINYAKSNIEMVRIVMETLFMLGALLDPTKSNNTIDANCADWAIHNDAAGVEIFRFFIDCRDQGRATIDTAAIDFHELATLNRFAKMLRLLFHRRVSNVWYEDMHFLSLLGRNPDTYDIFREIIDELEMAPHMRNTFLVHLAANGTVEAMEMVINAMGAKFQVTGEMLSVSALWDGKRNRIGPAMLPFLVEQLREVNNEVLITAISESPQGPELFDQLLSEVKPTFVLGEEVISKVVGQSAAKEYLSVLLRRQQAGFIVSEKVLVSAFSGDGCTAELLEIMMVNGGSDIPLTDEMICVAAGNPNEDYSPVSYLLELHGPTFPISDEVFSRAVKNPRSLRALLQIRSDIHVNDTMFIAACQISHDESLLMLLDISSENLPIQQMLHEIVLRDATSTFWMLLDRGAVELNEWTIDTISPSAAIMNELLTKYPDIPISQRAFEGAAGSGSLGLVRRLIKTRPEDLKVTEEVLMATFHGTSCEHEDTGSEIPITENLLQAACECDHPRALGRMEPLHLLLRHAPTLDLQTVWERYWLGGENKGGRDIVTNVLSLYTTLSVSESMLEAISSQDKRADEVSELDILVQFCLRRDISISGSEDVMPLILKQCSEKTVEAFVDSR